MFYANTPRTLREAAGRAKSNEGTLPYLNAASGQPGGYRSCSWGADDRRIVAVLKIIAVCGSILLLNFLF